MKRRRRALEPSAFVLAQGFPPIADARASILILGSLPGRKSLEMSQYYAQPHNAFWPIMGHLFDAGPALQYAVRLERLRAARIAVWDVLAAGERSGSLDSAIVTASIVVNDFAGFFARHCAIRLLCFNGAKAADLYRRRVLPQLPAGPAGLESLVLPSTSAANARFSFEAKLERWDRALQPAERHRDGR